MRIAVIGPQNTGKTTFVKDFIEAFPQFSTPNKSYRDLVIEENLVINQETSEQSQRAIRDFLLKQQENFEQRPAIFDRCVVDNYIYTKARYMAGGIRETFVEETAAIMYRSVTFFDTIIFIPTAGSVAFEEDTLRDTDRLFADQINRLYINTLFSLRNAIPHPIIAITGSREDRVAQAKEALLL